MKKYIMKTDVEVRSNRYECPHCGSEGWIGNMTVKLSPRYDHDKPEGGRCETAFDEVDPKDRKTAWEKWEADIQKNYAISPNHPSDRV